MATPELQPDGKYEFEGIRFWGIWDLGEYRTYMDHGGNVREFVLDVDKDGGHIDFLEYEQLIPENEREVAFRALYELTRNLRPEVITVEKPTGELI